MVRFQASEVVEGRTIVGFSLWFKERQKAEGGEYLILSRDAEAWNEYDPDDPTPRTDRKLYPERAGRVCGGYDGIERCELHPGRLSLRLEPGLAAQVGEREFETLLPPEARGARKCCGPSSGVWSA